MIYTPFSPHHKTPYGAVPSGASVTFTLRPPRSEGFNSGTLLARMEQDNDRMRSIPMPWISTDYLEDVFTGVLDTTGYVGLVWYSFQLEGLDGRCQEIGPYQLTVYDASEPVPDWFGEGVCYQIFPDRFHRGSVPVVPERDSGSLYSARFFHQDWTAEPWDGAVGIDAKGIPLHNRDFFGGTLAGITEKLDALAALGVETLYLCPIFLSAENHRYSTADYERIDPLLGDEADFRALCASAHERGMRVILDGVFSHTGSASRYFTGIGGTIPGAAQSQGSPFYTWYQWKAWPDDYACWWGIPTLPTLDKTCPSYQHYIYGAENAIVRRWLRAGADGWRLDVADELPDEFIAGLRQAVREENPNAVVLGEVWEDGSHKIAYGVRRKHLWGGHLDGLMNYPFRTALLEYLLGGDAQAFRSALETLQEHYPPFAFHNAMNFLGTHDTPRILTVLGLGLEQAQEAGATPLTPEQKKQALTRLKLGYAILFTFSGAPTLYYGDEAGLEGGRDPWNRRTYPWGRENNALLDWCRQLGQLRKHTPALRRGELVWGDCDGALLTYQRVLRNDYPLAGEQVFVAVNTGSEPRTLPVPWWTGAKNLLTGEPIADRQWTLAGESCGILTPRYGASDFGQH